MAEFERPTQTPVAPLRRKSTGAYMPKNLRRLNAENSLAPLCRKRFGSLTAKVHNSVDPEVTAEIRHAAEHVPGVRQVLNVRARWIGHGLNAELDVALDAAVTLSEADAVAGQFEHELFEHMPALSSARICVRPHDSAASNGSRAAHSGHGGGHHHALHRFR